MSFRGDVKKFEKHHAALLIFLTIAGVFFINIFAFSAAYDQVQQVQNNGAAPLVIVGTNTDQQTDEVVSEPEEVRFLAGLKTQIQSVIDGTGVDMAVYIQDLQTGEELEINSRTTFVSASMYKIFVSYEVARQIDLGLISPEPSSSLQPLFWREGWAPFAPYAHAPSVCSVGRGGRSPTMTFHPSLPWMPLRLVPGKDLEDIGIADVFDGLRLASQLDRRAQHYDYLLVVSELDAMHEAAERHAVEIVRLKRFGLYAVDPAAEGATPNGVESKP